MAFREIQGRWPGLMGESPGSALSGGQVERAGSTSFL